MKVADTRGLTLLETLIATVLLTMIAIACIPLLRSAAELTALTMHEPAGDPTLRLDVGRLADATIADPAVVGFKDMSELLALDACTLHWNAIAPELLLGDRLGSPGIDVSILRASQGTSDHAWIEFRCGEVSTYRWVALPEDPDPSDLETR